MQTPAQLLEMTLDRFKDGQMDVDNFLDDLDEFESYVSSFHDQLFELQPPSDFDEGVDMQERASECFGKLYDAIHLLRDNIDTTSDDFFEEARALCREAHRELEHLLGMSEEHASGSEFTA